MGWLETVRWSALCGEDTTSNSSTPGTSVFWDYEALVNTSTPDLPPCFQASAVTWTWCGALWISLPLYSVYLYTIKEGFKTGNKTKLNITKIVLAVLLVGLALADLIWTCTERSATYSPPLVLYIDPSIRAATYIAVGVLTHLVFCLGIPSSGMLFCFWLLQVLLNVIQFRSRIIRNLQDQRPEVLDLFRFSTFYTSYGLAILSLLLECFADTRPEPEVPDNNDDDTITERTPLLGSQVGHSIFHKLLTPCPEPASSFVSRLTHWWVTPLLLLGYRRPLRFEDLGCVRRVDECETVVRQFDTVWCREAGKKSPSLLRPLIATAPGPLVVAAVLHLIHAALQFLNPLLLNALIVWMGSADQYMWKGYVLSGALLGVNVLKGIIYQQAFKSSQVAALRIRTAIMGSIYRKTLRLSSESRKGMATGEVVNLLSVDADIIFNFVYEVNELWASPLTFIVAMYMLWGVLGVSSLAGIGFMVLGGMINGFLGMKAEGLQTTQMEHKDERMKKINELLNSIKVLKLYGWEPSFANAIHEVRKLELKAVRNIGLLFLGIAVTWFATPMMVPLCMFATYILTSKDGYLSPQTAFVAMNLTGLITTATSLLPLIIAFSAQAFTSVRRIKKTLMQSEVDETAVSRRNIPVNAVSFKDANFSWGSTDDGMTLKNLTLDIPEGGLVAIVGTVGSGKSSLLAAIIGEMLKHSGTVNVKGSVAYMPQEAWIQNTTFMKNVIFGRPLEDARYQRILEACALPSDLSMFPAGDQTEIGEKGINLSGGQKQRVSLARGVYQNTDIYLLDDPLSAVDAHVGKHIFEKVIGPNGLLNRKTRILVTHSIKYLPNCDTIFALRDGAVSEVGHFKQLLTNDGAFAQFLHQHASEVDLMDIDLGEEESTKQVLLQRLSSLSEDGKRELQIQRTASVDSSTSKTSLSRQLSQNTSPEKKDVEKEEKHGPKDVLIEEEVAEVGLIKWAVVKDYMLSATLAAAVLGLTSLLLFVGGTVGTNIWLSEWTNDQPINGSHADIGLHLGVFGALGVVQVIGIAGISLAIYLGGVVASEKIHARLLDRIIHAPMSFFDTTPLGRIINRFSSDMEGVDIRIPQETENWMYSIATVVATLITICYSTPIFLAVAVGLFLLYFIVQRIYIPTIRQMKRIDSIRKSPIYVNLDESLVGVTSVRAYCRQQDFITKNDLLINNSNRASYPIIMAECFLGLFLEVMGGLIIFFAALFAVLARNSITASLVGLSVNFAIQTSIFLGFVVRSTTELETNIVAAERIKEYSEIETEAPWEVDGNQPSDDWPASGEVVFSDYSARYRPGLDLVLRGINFTVTQGEKVGIVGRTGAGKSSVTLGLLRILEPASGKILVDGVDITQVGLHDLRSRLTIIPQDPMLFATSIRINLDPFGTYTDEEVWKSLELAHLNTFVSGLTAGLEHQVGESGHGISLGQRQLVCLARALLRRSKVLILDEATAAVDLETDELIQQTIRTAFSRSTVITIAHRINTIMDYDRVMVLDHGDIKEFAAPRTLLDDISSEFYSMAKDEGLV